MAQIELACKEAVFHFNKKHLEDPTIPMWVVKTQGETYYVEHVECNVPWSTKETPNNSHTKGSIKIKRCLIKIDEDNVASINPLTLVDIARIKKNKSVRLITHFVDDLHKFMKSSIYKHGPVKEVSGGCGSEFAIVDLMDKSELPLLLLAWPRSPGSLRVLMPNERYYDSYDRSGFYIPEEHDDDLYED